MNKLLKTRNYGIAMQNLGRELVIKDLSVNKIYHLNETASRIYQACDGQTPVTELASRFQMQNEFVLKTLIELNNLNLLDKVDIEGQSQVKKIKRRDVIQLFGLSGLFALLGSYLSGCGSSDNSSEIIIPVVANTSNPVGTGSTGSSNTDPFAPSSYVGPAGYTTPFAYSSPGPVGSDTPENKLACDGVALTYCQSKRGTLICIPPGNNYCACTCL